MSLAHAYAQVIREQEGGSSTSGFADKLVSLMRYRGHLSLLPLIVRILEREPVNSAMPVITTASEKAQKEFASAIEKDLTTLGGTLRGSTHVVDPRSVGGYSVRVGSRTIDRSFRTALVSLYQNTTRA